MKNAPIAMLLAATLSVFPVLAADVDAAAMLAAHNRWRTEAGVADLSYSPDLAASAQVWADALQQSNHCQMRHSSPDGRYGENLFWGSAQQWSDGRRALQPVSPEQVVASWASEKRDYDYADNRCAPGKMCGHYTQVVWNASTAVGCAMAVCQDSLEQVWVCQYQPAGNWVGQKPY